MIKKLSKLLLSLLMVLSVLDLSGLSVKAEDDIDLQSFEFTMSTYYVHKGEPLQLEYLVNGEVGVGLDVTFSKRNSYDEVDLTPQGLFTSTASGWFYIMASYDMYTAYSRVYVLSEDEVLLTAKAGDGYFVSNWDSNISKNKVKYISLNKGQNLSQLYWGDFKTEIDNDHLVFSDWYYDAEFTRPAKRDDIINEDITIYAKYDKEAYMVTAHYNDGYTYGLSTNNGIAKIKVPKGEEIGYQIDWEIYSNDESKGFEAWYFEEDFSGTPYFYLENYVPTSDIDVYAKYSPLSTVTFDYNGGYWLSGDEKKYTDSYTFVPARRKSFYYWAASTPLHDDPNLTFSHWELADGTEVTNSYIPTGDMTVYAVYDEPYTIRYHIDLNKGYFDEDEEVSVIERKIKKGSSLDNQYPFPRARSGYGFLNWYTESDYQNAIYNIYWYVPESDMDLYARMSPQIKITYDANGGYFYSSDALTTDAFYLTESEYSFTYYPSATHFNERKIHVGFSFDKEGNSPVNYDNFRPQENMTLYAMWAEAVFVNFHMMEGTYNNQNDVVAKYQKGTNLNIGYSSYRPTREGYVFDKWYLTPERDGKGYDYYELNNLYQELNEDVHLYAGYKRQYKLTFDANGEKFTNNRTQIESKMTEGSVVSPNSSYIPKGVDFLNPSKVFVGWYDNPECTGEKETFIDYVLDSDKTYYAKWEDEYYTITFHGMGGTYNNQTDIIRKYQKNGYINETVPLFSKFGFSRGDWYYDEELTQKADIVASSSLMLNIDRDYDLYVSYLPNYKVYIDSNGGEFYSRFNQGKKVVEYTSMEEGYTMYKLSTGLMKSEVDGKVFAGYSLSPNGEVDDYVGKVISEDVTLYAIYTEDFVTVTLRTEYGGYYNNTTGKYDKEKTYKVPRGTELRHSQSIANVEGPTERYEVVYKTKKGDIAAIGNGLYNYVVEEDEVINAEFTFFDTVKVRFHGNGGLSSSGEEVDERTTIRGKPYNYDFYYDIYFYYPDNSKTFLRFTYDQEGKKLVRPYDIINEDTDIYAQWSDEVWTITYNYNGGYNSDGKSIETEKVFKGKTTSYHHAYNDGSLGQFVGWFTEPEGGESRGSQGSTYIPTKDETLYAHFEKEIVTLTLDAGNGYFNNNINNKVITSRFVKGALGYFNYYPTHPEGYEFVGFYDNPQFTGSKYEYPVTLYNDLTLYAKFNEVIVPVESVLITQNDLTLKESQTSKLTATVYPENANNKKITWSSSDDSVATVSSTGLVTAVAPGTATITVTSEYDNSIKDSITVTVLETPTYTVKFDGAGGTSFDDQILLEGEKAANPGTPTREGYVFSGWYLGEEEYNFDNEVTANITLIAKWTEEDETVYVNEIKFDGDINEATIKVGEEYFIVAYPHPANAADRTITYTSEDAGVATVDGNGKVTGVSEGTTKIVLTSGDGNVTAKFTIHVENLPDSLETDVLVVKPEEMELKQGSTASLTAYPPSDATNTEVVWESSDPTVASVDANGKVSGNKVGEVTITATLKDADVNALNEAITDAENAHAQAEQELTEAEEAEETARLNAESKQANYEEKQGLESAAQIALNEANATLQEITNSITSKNNELSSKRAELPGAKATYNTAKDEYDIAKEAADNAEIKRAKGSLGYFEERGSTAAVNIINDRLSKQDKDDWGNTTIGDSKDATSLENMRKAIALIAKGNEYRANDEYNSGEDELPLKISDHHMAVAQVQTNASVTKHGHSQLYSSNENLAWGYTNPYDGWYTKEKPLFESYIATHPEVYGYSGYGDFSKFTTFFNGSKAGHYINLINPTGYNMIIRKATGFGYNTSKGITTGQIFSGATSDTLYTVEEYLADLDAYIAELDNAANVAAQKKEVMDAAADNVSVIEDRIAELESEISDLTSQKEDQVQEVAKKGFALALAQSNTATALSEKNAADTAYANAQQITANKEQAVANRLEDIETAKYNLRKVQTTAKVTVIATIEKVEVDKTKVELKVGESSKVTATITPSDATNKNVTWISSNPDYVTVDEEGNLTAIKRTKDNEPIKVIVRTEEGLKEAEVEVTVIQPVTSVTVSETEATVNNGDEKQFTATVLPEDANNKEVTWSSSNTKVATVDQSGKVKAVGPGAATITVTTKDGNKKATITLNVLQPVESVSLNKTLTMDAGTSSQLKATINPTNATNKNVTWKSSNESVASVDKNGKVTAYKKGTTTITVTTQDGGKTATCTVTVNQPVTDIEVNKVSTTLTVGESETFVATVLPEDADNKKVTWSTSNSAIAVVSNGTITARGVGTATITVKTEDGNKTATVTVIVKAISMNKASITGLSAKTYTGKAITQTPTVKLGTTTLKSGTDYTVAYKNNKNVGTATVTITGKGNYEGTVTKTFKINPASIAKATVTGISNKSYTGKEIKPTPTVKVGTTTLKSGTDYTVAYKNNVKIGTATVTITGKGNYTGTVSKTFKITDNTKITLNKTTATIGTMNVGKYTTTLQLKATVTGNSNTKVTWTSSNPSVAKVDANGKVTGVSDPKHTVTTVTITATTVDGKKATCKVTVEDPVSAFIRRLYKYCLNRQPEKGGFDYWYKRLKNKEIDAAAAVEGFFESNEMKNMNLSHAETIERCYLVMMDRKSDAGGKKYWEGVFKEKGKKHVLQGFVESNEFTRICKDFNIIKGNIIIK